MGVFTQTDSKTSGAFSSADSKEPISALSRSTCFRYVDEQVFRYNNRKKPMDDDRRFDVVLSHVPGKRLTYAE